MFYFIYDFIKIDSFTYIISCDKIFLDFICLFFNMYGMRKIIHFIALYCKTW